MSELVGVTGWGYCVASIAPLRDSLGLTGYSITSTQLCAVEDPVEALLTALPQQRVGLLAWSLGGMLGLCAALRQPERFSYLVLLGTAATFLQDAQNTQGTPKAALLAMRRKLRGAPEAVLSDFAKQVHPQSHSLLEANSSDATVQTALRHGLSFLASFDIRSEVHRLEVPCLLLHGANDAIVPLSANTALVQMLPQAQQHVLPAAGHMPWLAQSALTQIRKTVRDFIEAGR